MCFTNGLCKAPTDDQYNWNWRIGCTDPTFSDPACPNYCQGLGGLFFFVLFCFNAARILGITITMNAELMNSIQQPNRIR